MSGPGVTGVFILGSCVSRDAFGPHTGARFDIAGYVARSAWGSAFAGQPFEVDGLDRIASPFQRRMATLDTGKGLPRLLAETSADIILIDLIDERFDLFVGDSGAIATLSPELLASGFQPAAQPGRVLRSGSEAFYALWEAGWQKLLALLRQRRLLDRVVINRVFWSGAHQDGTPFGAGQTPARIATANRYLERLYARLAQDLPPRHFIAFPPELMTGSLTHRWGSSPFHYIDEFYVFMANALTEIAAVQTASTRPAATAQHILLQQSDAVLGESMAWYALQAPQGAVLRLDCRINVASSLKEQRVVLCLECLGPDGARIQPGGMSLSSDPSIGFYRYLIVEPGANAISTKLVLPIGFRTARLGLRAWKAPQAMQLQDLRVVFVPRSAPKPRTTILSVDVEALPGRAETDSVERLIFGRFGDGQAMGIGRLCDMFDGVGAKATFFIDYSTCDLHGEQGLFAAGEMLKARGHDIQLHMHSEVLVRQRNWPYSTPGMPAFDELDVDVACAALQYGVDRFQRNLGERPRIFRPGGMRHSRKMVEAVKQVGIEAVSSLYRGHGIKTFKLAQEQPLFAWDNGVLEAPLDFALDPLTTWGSNRDDINALMELRAERPVYSILLHSTSLLYRATSNKPPHFTGYEPRYEQRLQEYLDWFARRGTFMTFSELLDSTPSLPTLSLDAFYPGESACGAAQPQARQFDYQSIVQAKAAPSYSLTLTQPAHQEDAAHILRHVPAPQLPLKLAAGQRLALVTAQDGEGSSALAYQLAYIVTGHKAYLMRQRCVLPGGPALHGAIEAVFARNPRVTLILAQSAMEETPVTGFSSKAEIRRTYVLDLPSNFEDYRRSTIAKKLRGDIERKERTIQDILPGCRVTSLSGATLDEGSFLRAAGLIETRLRHKVAGQEGAPPVFAAEDAARQWDIYRQSGEVVQLWNGTEVYAAALCLHFERDCFFMAAGYRDVAPTHCLGNMLLYRLIESLIARGVRRLHLGGGDFGYKSRFGARERALCNYEFVRPLETPLKSRVLAALDHGVSPALLELDLATPLESILGADFETALGVDFDAVVENAQLGTDGRARRYQATSREAFTLMMKQVPFDATETFVDIGCGKGKMLYYAAQLGYRRCVGVEIADMLLQRAQANFARLQLPAEIVLLQRDASNIPLADLDNASLFYLYNPFSEEIMRGFLLCLLKSQQQQPRKLRIVYCNALFEAPFEKLGFYPAKIFVDGVEGWRFGHAVIYERDADDID